MRSSISEVVGDYSMAGTRRMDAPGNIRVGFLVKGDRGSHLDVDQEEDLLPKAVVVYVKRGNRVLAVSRRGDASNLNMPGGLVEPGEDPRDAAVRELWEETGIKADEIYPVCTMVRGGYVVTAYRVTTFHGEIRPSREGTPTWTKEEDVARSNYGDFFLEMLKCLGDAHL